MNPNLISNLKEIFIVPVGSFIALAFLSFTIGWNIFTLLVFWFLFIPLLASILPTLFSKDGYKLKQSLVGLIIFYVFMIFMIYEHFQSDYFLIMLLSLLVNICVVSLFVRIRNNVGKKTRS